MKFHSNISNDFKVIDIWISKTLIFELLHITVHFVTHNQKYKVIFENDVKLNLSSFNFERIKPQLVDT